MSVVCVLYVYRMCVVCLLHVCGMCMVSLPTTKTKTQAVVQAPRSFGGVHSTESGTHQGGARSGSLAQSAPPVESRPHTTAAPTAVPPLPAATLLPPPPPPLDAVALFQSVQGPPVGGAAPGPRPPPAMAAFGAHVGGHVGHHHHAHHPQFPQHFGAAGLLQGIGASHLPFGGFAGGGMLDAQVVYHGGGVWWGLLGGGVYTCVCDSVFVCTKDVYTHVHEHTQHMYMTHTHKHTHAHTHVHTHYTHPPHTQGLPMFGTLAGHVPHSLALAVEKATSSAASVGNHARPTPTMSNKGGAPSNTTTGGGGGGGHGGGSSSTRKRGGNERGGNERGGIKESEQGNERGEGHDAEQQGAPASKRARQHARGDVAAVKSPPRGRTTRNTRSGRNLRSQGGAPHGGDGGAGGGRPPRHRPSPV